MATKRSRGFTIVEILVVVAIVAILAAIAIANYIGTVNRAKQKRTVADMRTVATAWEAYSQDSGTYSAAGFTLPAVPLPAATLRSRLVPTYTRTFIELDGWNRPIEYWINAADPTGATTEYAMRSAGRDGTFEGTTYTQGTFNDIDNDIVFANGNFVSYPESMQSDD